MAKEIEELYMTIVSHPADPDVGGCEAAMHIRLNTRRHLRQKKEERECPDLVGFLIVTAFSDCVTNVSGFAVHGERTMCACLMMQREKPEKTSRRQKPANLTMNGAGTPLPSACRTNHHHPVGDPSLTTFPETRRPRRVPGRGGPDQDTRGIG